MSAQDPDVRPGLEHALREEITRKEERIRALEAQLDHAQRTSPIASAPLPRTPSPATPRPPIRLPVFDGAPISVIADRVQALANARNMPDRAASTPVFTTRPMPISIPDDAADGFEPTARLDAGQLRHAHRALAQTRSAAHHRAPVTLLCLGAATLWGGIWQMRLRERQNAASFAPQSATDTPVIAAVRLNSATPMILPEAELRTAGSLPAAAVPTQGAEHAGTNLPRSTYTPRSIAPPPVLFHSPRRAFAAAAAPQNAALSAFAQSDAPPTSDLKPQRKPAPPTRRHTTLAQITLAEDAASERNGPNRKTRLMMPTTKAHQTTLRVSRATAWVSRPRPSAPRGQEAASAHPLPAASYSSYGTGESGSSDTEERAVEQAETARVPRSAHAHSERTSDIEANVDHAMQTLDKMRELLDGMDRGRKTPAHP